MQQFSTLGPWALVLLGVWLIMWGARRLFGYVTRNNNPTYSVSFYDGLMALIAIITGILFLLTH